MTRKILATATFSDVYGSREAVLTSTNSSRNGKKVTIYRWSDCGFLPFLSVDRAVNAAKNHALMSNVQAA